MYLREIFRHATRRWELECPRGFRKSGMTAAETETQEIAEELGLEIEGMHYLGEINGNTGLLAGIAHVERSDESPCYYKLKRY